jgi:osmoprotectant transport system permease protein
MGADAGEAGRLMLIADVWDWFTTGSHWTGTDGIPNRLLEHVSLCAEVMLVAGLMALPIALTLGHLGRGGFLAINISNIGRAIPSFALLVLVAQLWGLGRTPALVALIALAIPPVMTNAYVGMRQVDPDVRDVARGMGMSGWQVVSRVELPLAAGLVLAGIRTSTVQVVATATLAAYVAFGGLGRYVVDGFGTQDYAEVFAGAILVAVLALLVELALGAVQRWAAPPSAKADLTPGAQAPPVATS